MACIFLPKTSDPFFSRKYPNNHHRRRHQHQYQKLTTPPVVTIVTNININIISTIFIIVESIIASEKWGGTEEDGQLVDWHWALLHTRLKESSSSCHCDHHYHNQHQHCTHHWHWPLLHSRLKESLLSSSSYHAVLYSSSSSLLSIVKRLVQLQRWEAVFFSYFCIIIVLILSAPSKYKTVMCSDPLSIGENIWSQ